MKFKAIIFDLDGTLLNTLDDIADSMNTVLKRAGYPQHNTQAYTGFIGDGINLLVKRALSESDPDPGTIRHYVKAMREEYAKRWTDKTRPYPGIAEMLQRCEHAGLKMGVLTNKLEVFAKELLGLLLPGSRFDLIWGSRPDLPKKPDPGGALMQIEALNLRPADCAYLGDMPVDMETAVSAGMYALGALWGFCTADELFGAGAQAVIRQPIDLLPWL